MSAESFRQTQKAATRQKVLAAARQLFTTVGYEGATVRQIALTAGVSVGSVFTNFASKGEILSAVMAERLEALYAELDRVRPRLQGSTAQRLCSLFGIYFAFEAQHVQLFLAHIAAAYDWTASGDAAPYGRNQRLMESIAECLRQGVAEGDVDPAIELRAVTDLLMSAFAWTFRLAAWENASAERMTEVMERQVALIASGFRPR